ncbi:hypothetical protein ACFT5C_17340 [Streptomyces sp. NPDC057116]|uniref:hypothetical protein n=1 Tax=Streptomyces sp. NPDC057116 TaxID=3346023 RepID=UPI00362988FB
MSGTGPGPGRWPRHDSGAQAPPGAGGTSGNAYQGSNAAQGGWYNTQINHYAPPRGKSWIAVTAAAALVVIGAAVVAWLELADRAAPDGTRPDSSQRRTETPRSASTPAGPAAAPALSEPPPVSSAPPPAASPGSPAVRWQGDLRVASRGPQLDGDPPQMSDYDRDVALMALGPPYILYSDSIFNEANLAVWDGPGVPGRRECFERVSTLGMGHVEVEKGTVLCVRTGGGRVARLTVTSVGADQDGGVLARATVWSEVSR